jgi:organic hydroperoxide reductase OsmC/OhrA
LFFKPAGPGFSRVTVIDSAGGTASVTVRVEDGSAAHDTIHVANTVCAISPCINKAVAGATP